MIPSEVALATEDKLSEALGMRLLTECAPDLPAPRLLQKNGVGYLRSKMNAWLSMAQRHPVIVLTDLDQKACVPALISEWFGNASPSANLILRVAVREAESWLMADHLALRKLIPRGVLPQEPDDLPNPKAHFLHLAARYASK